MLLWLLVLLLVIFAIAGGAAVNSFLWLLLIVAVVVAVFALISGRSAAEHLRATPVSETAGVARVPEGGRAGTVPSADIQGSGDCGQEGAR